MKKGEMVVTGRDVFDAVKYLPVARDENQPDLSGLCSISEFVNIRPARNHKPTEIMSNQLFDSSPRSFLKCPHVCQDFTLSY